MKDQRHKRRESFSVLFISNLDGRTKQFQLSAWTLRLMLPLLLLVFAAAGFFAGRALTAPREPKGLKEQLASQEQTIQQLEAEKETLTKDKESLAKENEALRQQAENPPPEEETPPEPEEPPVPDRYPSEGAGVLKSTYSEESPYIAISTYREGTIVAAGSGTVTAISSDDTYSHIIEIEHEGGYQTRYLCHEEAEVKVEEGGQVQQGDPLLTITTDDTQLDYQIILNGETVDPLSVIDAKG